MFRVCNKLNRNQLKTLEEYRTVQKTRRLLTTTASHSAEKSSDSKKDVKQSQSFTMNLFRGQLQTSQVFPYPNVLNDEQTETLTSLVDPVTKFFKEVNNPLKNDEIETVEPNTLEGLWDMGAFSLQVPQDLGGLGLSNTQYARMVEIVGAHDLAVEIGRAHV